MTEARVEPTETAAEVFSPEAFEKSLHYTTTAPIEKIRQDLDVMRHIDEVNEKKERFWKRLLTASSILTFVSFFFFFVTVVMAEVYGWMMIFVPIGFIAITIPCYFKTAAHGRLNLDNRRYGVIDELLRFLSRDMASDAVVEVSIDFHKYDADERYREESKSAAESFSVPWLSMKGRFVDKSRFRLAMAQKVKRKERRKRKYTKVKEAFREKVVLTLLPDLTSYPDLSQAEALLYEASVHPDIHLTDIQVAQDRIVLVASSGVHRRVKGRNGTTNQDADQKVGDVHALLSLFLAVYNCLGRCQKAA